MFGSIFGTEMPLAVRFFLAFLIVLGLIGVTAWAVRRFGTGRLGGSSARGRQPRLAVIDYASVDARRRLILVRRDNVEHLLMIGGPTDVVVESNIVRAVPAARDLPTPRMPAADTLPRAIPLSESGLNGSGGSWPLQPEPAAPLRPTPRSDVAPEEPASWPLQPHADTPARPQRDTLIALADELSIRPAPQRNRPGARPAHPPESRVAESRGEPRAEPKPEPQVESQPDTGNAGQAAEPAIAANDQSLAEMAHRLEAALRKPAGSIESREGRTGAASAPSAVPRAPAAAEPIEPAEPAAAAPPSPAAPSRPARAADQKSSRSDAKAPSQGKLYDSLEQEMASLLGRPTTKT